MTRHFIMLALTLGLLSTGSAAHAGKGCPWNDKHQPEKSKICRQGNLYQCEEGQWVNLGIKCAGGSRLQAEDRVSLDARRILPEARPEREAIIARIAPQS
jgi:hypothetical protein